MKTFRYHIALLIVILIAIATNVQAQDDERALGAAADTIIRTETRDYIVNRIVESVYQNHPTASLATRLAKAYYNYNENSETKERMFHKNDTTHAFLYIRRAIELDPKYAGSYVLASDILDYLHKDDEAMRWLDEGVKHNPTDPSLYMAQAKLLVMKNEQAAVEKIDEIRKIDSKFPVDLELARMYYKLFDRGGSSEQRFAYYEKVVEYYLKADKNDMTVGDLGQCCMAISFILGSHSEYVDKWYELTTFGVQKFPEDIAMRKFLLYACRSGQKWDEGIAAAGSYFSMIEAEKVQPIDYLNYGICLRNVKRYDEAIAQYEKAVALEDCPAYMKEQAENNIAAVITAQVDEVRKAGDFQKAIDIIKPYVEKYKAMGKQNDRLILAYAGVYQDWASKSQDTQREELFLNAANIYEAAISNSELNAPLFAYYCWWMYTQIDPEKDKALALPYANKVIDMLKGKTELSKNEKRFLCDAYWYFVGYEYIKKSNKKAAMDYTDKILDIDPTYEQALNFINIVSRK